MQIIQTVYPCEGCKREISPSNEFCPHCGTKQPDSSERLNYNLFSTRDETEFHMSYAGDPILSLEDIETLAKRDANSQYSQYFIAAYYVNNKTVVRTSQFGSSLKVEHWWPLFRSGIGDDLGERVITLNFLERG